MRQRSARKIVSMVAGGLLLALTSPAAAAERALPVREAVLFVAQDVLKQVESG